MKSFWMICMVAMLSLGGTAFSQERDPGTPARERQHVRYERVRDAHRYRRAARHRRLRHHRHWRRFHRHHMMPR